MKILVADDDHKLNELICDALREADFDPESAHSASEAAKKIQYEEYALTLVDWIFTDDDLDGCDLIKKIKTKNQELPILMLTGRSALADRVHGLSEGADDYLVKPFHLPELIARVKALLRRQNIEAKKSKKITIGKLTIDTDSHKVLADGKLIHLSKREFEILQALLLNYGKTISREEIADKIWEPGTKKSSSNVIDVHVSILRQKLGGNIGKNLKTIRGYGYQFEA